jgi:hypothetical protein
MGLRGEYRFSSLVKTLCISLLIWNMHLYVTCMFEGATYTLHVPD